MYRTEKTEKTDRTDKRQKKINEKLAIRKCLTHYRQTVSAINKKLNTPQIKQCGQQWATIDFFKEGEVSKQTLKKQNAAFLYNNTKKIEEEDRLQCRENYLHAQDAVKQAAEAEEAEAEEEQEEQEEKEHLTWNEIVEILADARYKWADEEIKQIWMQGRDTEEEDDAVVQGRDTEEEDDAVVQGRDDDDDAVVQGRDTEDNDIKEEEELVLDYEEELELRNEPTIGEEIVIIEEPEEEEEEEEEEPEVVEVTKKEEPKKGWFGWLGWN
jgi:hypothetical protein